MVLASTLNPGSAKKQPIVSRSNTKVEYRSLSIVTTELYWLCMLFKDLHIFLSNTPTIWYDNLGAITLASNPIFHARTKYIEVKYHFIREKVLNQDIHIKFIFSSDQCVDIFTKGLTTAWFLWLCDKLMLRELPISLRGCVNQYSLCDPSSL